MKGQYIARFLSIASLGRYLGPPPGLGIGQRDDWRLRIYLTMLRVESESKEAVYIVEW